MYALLNLWMVATAVVSVYLLARIARAGPR